jgi:hypothetical protein
MRPAGGRCGVIFFSHSFSLAAQEANYIQNTIKQQKHHIKKNKRKLFVPSPHFSPAAQHSACA